MVVGITEIMDFIVTRGDTNTFLFTVRGNNASDLAPDTAYFSVKKTVDSTSYAFQKALGSGISLFDSGQDSETHLYYKKYEVRVAPADTENLPLGKYIYDLELTFGSDTYTRIKGNYEITWDATRPAS